MKAFAMAEVEVAGGGGEGGDNAPILMKSLL